MAFFHLKKECPIAYASFGTLFSREGKISNAKQSRTMYPSKTWGIHVILSFSPTNHGSLVRGRKCQSDPRNFATDKFLTEFKIVTLRARTQRQSLVTAEI